MTKSEDNYWKARSYAFKLDPNNYRDLVHDAWLVWYKYKKTDLFEEDNKLVITCVKRRYYNSLYGTKYRTVKGQKVPILFSIVYDDYELGGEELHQAVLPDLRTPENLIINREEILEYERKYGPMVRQALELYGKDKSLRTIRNHLGLKTTAKTSYHGKRHRSLKDKT